MLFARAVNKGLCMLAIISYFLYGCRLCVSEQHMYDYPMLVREETIERAEEVELVDELVHRMKITKIMTMIIPHTYNCSPTNKEGRSKICI